jgi:hypothetical protein
VLLEMGVHRLDRAIGQPPVADPLFARTSVQDHVPTIELCVLT